MANSDYLLTIEGVRGESKRKEDAAPIEIRSFHYGVSVQSEGISGRKARIRQYTDVTFTKIVDKASTTIQTLLRTNARIEKVTLTAYKATGGKPLDFYKITLSDAYISSYRVQGVNTGDDHGALPTDEFTVNFRKIEVEYDPQGSAGAGTGKSSFADDLDANV